MSKRFSFSVQVDHVLTVEEIWPDGNAPENPTSEDARDVFLNSSHCSIGTMLDCWNIGPNEDDLIVTELEEGVTFNGE
jgi:hypothetical protein